MKETDVNRSKRAEAFALWMDAPMPMVTIFKTLDVTNLVKQSRRHGCKWNMLMCWCIGKAASRIEEFYSLPVGRKWMQFDKIAVNTVVALKGGGISTCDIPFSESLRRFNRDYLTLTRRVYVTGKPHDLGEDYMVIGTSALARVEIDGAVNIYSGIYNNPFLIWGKYRGKYFKASLPISFQFHHAQMDGAEAAQFLAYLQQEIAGLEIKKRKGCCILTRKEKRR